MSSRCRSRAVTGRRLVDAGAPVTMKPAGPRHVDQYVPAQLGQASTRRQFGRKVGPPRYKSKKDTRQSIRLNSNAFSLTENGTVYVAKVGNLKVRWFRRLPAAPTSLTVTKDSCGRYFLSFVV